ncbi:hypothetical protein KUV89_13520 [Marinobacter hydrocarbonoclasticus]|nr:hypothetical protein [Marinobacter nauticus]
MKPIVAFTLIALLSGCGITNTTFNRPYLPEGEAPLVKSVVPTGERVLVAKVVDIEQADYWLVDVADWPAVVGAKLPITLIGARLPQFPGACPEEAAAASTAVKRVEALVAEASRIELSDLTRSQQFGLNGRIWLDGSALDQTLIEEELAQQGTPDWCP